MKKKEEASIHEQVLTFKRFKWDNLPRIDFCNLTERQLEVVDIPTRSLKKSPPFTTKIVAEQSEKIDEIFVTDTYP